MPHQRQSWSDVVINRPNTTVVGSQLQSALKTAQALHVPDNAYAPPGVRFAENIDDSDSDDNDADSDNDDAESDNDEYSSHGNSTATWAARIKILMTEAATTHLLLIFGVDLNGTVPIDDSGNPAFATTGTRTRSLRQVCSKNQEHMGTSSFRWPTSSKIRSLCTKA